MIVPGALSTMPGWRKAWLIALALLLVGQTLARMIGHRLAFATPPLGHALHLLLIAAWLGFVVLLLWRLPERWRGWPVAAIVFTLLMGGAHALATYSDLFHLIWYHFVHGPAPVWLPFENPALTGSLLSSIGIGPAAVFAVVALLLALHLLLYAAVAGPVVRAVKDGMAPPRRIGPLPARYLAAAPLLLLVIVMVRMPPVFWRYEMLHRAAKNAFQMAPPGLMLAPPPDGPAPPPVAAAHPRPLVLIIVDALRRDRMGLYNPPLANTPFLDSLQRTGKLHVYSGYATCTLSYCGIMSILASRSWDQFGRRPPTILDALARHSYRNHIILSGSHADFGNIAKLYGRGVVQRWEQGRTPPADDRRALAALAATRFEDPAHSFLYLHLASAHAGSLIEPQFARGDWPEVPYAQVYDARVRQSDAKLGEVFSILRAGRMLDHALVIITADHGERLGENGALFHGGPPDEPATAIPILVYDAEDGTWPQHRLTSTVDVAPTFLRAIGGIAGEGWRGQALQEAPSRAAAPLGTGDYTGAVAELGGRFYRYLCRREDGRETIKLLDGKSLEGAAVPPGAERDRLLPLLRRLHGQATSAACHR